MTRVLVLWRGGPALNGIQEVRGSKALSSTPILLTTGGFLTRGVLTPCAMNGAAAAQPLYHEGSGVGHNCWNRAAAGLSPLEAAKHIANYVASWKRVK
jgi:hypothetical protein